VIPNPPFGIGAAQVTTAVVFEASATTEVGAPGAGWADTTSVSACVAAGAMPLSAVTLKW
jgi:predicted RNA-binding Zn ribbon-like protein